MDYRRLIILGIVILATHDGLAPGTPPSRTCPETGALKIYGKKSVHKFTTRIPGYFLAGTSTKSLTPPNPPN